MKRLSLLLLLLSSSVFAQKEIVQGYYANGIVKSTIVYEDGIRNGNCNFYTEDGSLFSSMQYSNGLLHGLLIAFYDNGFTKRKSYYKLGCKSSKSLD